jgi:hypothetical protein
LLKFLEPLSELVLVCCHPRELIRGRPTG